MIPIPIYTGKNWYVDVYLGYWLWLVGFSYDDYGCGWCLEFNVPLFCLQIGRMEDEDWDEEAVYEPIEDEWGGKVCPECGGHVYEDRCNICNLPFC